MDDEITDRSYRAMQVMLPSRRWERIGLKFSAEDEEICDDSVKVGRVLGQGS